MFLLNSGKHICSSVKIFLNWTVPPRVVVGFKFLQDVILAASGSTCLCMSDRFDPESKSTHNIRLDVAEPISSLIIIEQDVFAPLEHFGTGMCVSMSWDSMSLVYIASMSSDSLSKDT